MRRLRLLLPLGLGIALASLVPAARALGPDEVQSACADVDAEKIAGHVKYLTCPELMGRKVGSKGAALAVAYLAKQFGESKLQQLPGEKSFVVPADGEENVLGLVEGSDRKAEAIVISAHWDGVGQDDAGKLVPGADENATGLAGLLEAARVLGRTRPHRTIVFAAFGGFWDKDDVGKRFRGAKGFVKQARGGKPAWKAAFAPICGLDLMSLGVPLMPFSPERFFVLGSESSSELTTVVKDLAGSTTELKLARPAVDLVEKMGPRDDYEAYRQGEVPFLFLISGVSKHFHKPSDTAETVDCKRVGAATRLVARTVAAIDALEKPPAFAKQDLREGKSDAEEVRTLLQAALDPASKLDMTSQERKALTFKLEKVEEMLENGEVTAKDRGLLQDTLALLLVVLTK